MNREQTIAAIESVLQDHIPSDVMSNHDVHVLVSRVADALVDVTQAPASEWENYAENVQRIGVDGGWLYRTCSWVELPTAVDEPNRGYDHWSNPVFVPATPEPVSNELTDLEHALMVDGHKIDAIKAVRQRLQIPLKEALAVVDRAYPVHGRRV